MLVGTDFIFYLVDTPTGLCYYKDSAGRTQKTPLNNGSIDCHLMNSPGKWMDQQLSFIRNKVYQGINRSYSEPLLFVRQAATMIRELYYGGIGIDTPLTLVVFKRNPSGIPTTYNLYYKGQIDLTTSNDTITEGFEANLIEGDLLALIKSYENQIVEIRCDGSIPENVKWLADGWLLPDTFNYQFVPIPLSGQGFFNLPAFYINNEGDNFGITHMDTNLDQFSNVSYFTTPNKGLFYAESAIDVQVKGSIVVSDAIVNLFLATSKTVFDGTKLTNTVSLISGASGVVDINNPIYNKFSPQETLFNFDAKISLEANETLFIIYYVPRAGGGNPRIVSGNFQLIFNSAPIPVTPWAITWFDVGKLLLKSICTAASTTTQTFNYDFKSDLLSDNLNLLISPGDSLRAAADPDYGKYFNYQNLRNSPTSGLVIEYGPVIKTTLKDFFKAVDCEFCAALGNQTIDGKQYLYVEKRQYAFNPNDNVMSIGEVANMKFAFMKEFAITGFKIGYQPQTYDQKAGKYEPNTTAEWSINTQATVANIMDIVSPWRADPIGIQRLCSGIGAAATSTTNNDSDNSIFIINTDPTKKTKDYVDFVFTSLVQDYNLSSNTNILLVANNNMQAITMNSYYGSYLSLNNDPSIFVFCDPLMDGTIVKNIAFSCSGFFLGNQANAALGLPTDYVTLEMWAGGLLYYDQTFQAVGASTNFSFNPPTLNRLIHIGDAVYIKIKTSLNATGAINVAELFVTNSDTTAYWSASGAGIPITGGDASSLLPMPTIIPGTTGKNASGVPINASGIPIVSYGFQYYQFNSFLNNPNFTYYFNVNQLTQSTTGNISTYTLFKNGVSVLSSTIPDSQQFTSEGSAVDSLAVGDVFYFLASVGNINVQIIGAEVVFNSQIDVSALKRVQYDYLAGIPNFATDSTGAIRSDIAGAPFNIEFLTPRRMFERWFAYFASIMYASPLKQVLFCSLSKNQYLVTSFNGKVYAENQNVSRSSMGDGFFLPFQISCDVLTDLTFSETQTGAANSCVTGTFNGFNIIGFPEKVSQKPALNETQNWQLRCAWGINLPQLFNLEYTGLNNFTMLPGTIRSATLNSVKFFPQGLTLDPKYRTPDPDMFPFKDTVSGWLNQDGYCLPWYTGYSVPLQFRANGLSPITVYLYDCCGVLESTTVFTQKTSPAVIYPDTLWEGSIDLTGVDPGSYYLVVQGGTSSGAFLQSEPIDIRAVDSSDRIMLLEYSNSNNHAEMIFDTGFKAQYYLPGFNDNKAKPGFKGAFYVDQPQNIIIENGIVYRTREIHIIGIPDYEIERFLQVMMCDTVFIENVQYSLNAQEDPEIENFTKGAPKKSWKMLLRTSKSSTGVSASASGPVQDATMILTLDANAVMPNINNDSQSTEPNIIAVEITTS